MSLLFCLCVFCDSFLCSISLLLLSGSLSYILNSVYTINVIVHGILYRLIATTDNLKLIY